MRLVPDQHAVQQFAAARLYPPFDDRVHPRHAHAAEDDLNVGVGKVSARIVSNSAG
jgi:hypothetical protein